MKKFKEILVRPLLFIMLVSVMISCKDDPVVLPTASFNVSATTAGTDVLLKFTNASENSSYYIWNFDDDVMSTDENPTHSFKSTGIYRVSLIAIGENSSDTAYKSITITEGNVSIFEGEGITGVSLFETTWGEIETNFGVDTANLVRYNENYDYYYFIVSYNDLGITFYLFSNGESTLSSYAEVFAICVFGNNYGGGTTEYGIGVRSTVSDMVDAYGDAEEEIPGEYMGDTYTYYSYPSLGVDFIDLDENLIYEIDIYSASEEKSTSSSNSIKGVKENIQKFRNEHFIFQ